MVEPEPSTPQEFSRFGPAVWLGLFGVVAFLKRSAIWLPSSWDESWAVLPASLWLSENSFAILDLARLPGWSEGGPSTKVFSPVTLLTGLVASGTTEASFLPVLHVIHFAIGGVVLLQVHRFARPVWSRFESSVLVMATAVLPTVNTQLGAVYLELPMMATGLLSVNAALSRKWRSATLWGLLTVWIKPSGIIPITGVMVVLWLTGRAKISRVAMILGVSALGFIPGTAQVTLQRDLGRVLLVSVKTLSAAPMLTLGALTAVALGTRYGWVNRHEESGLRLLTSIAIIVTFMAFYAAVIVAVRPIDLLPRYLIQIAPFALFGGGHVIKSLYGTRVASIFAIVVIAFSLLNTNGRFDPDKLSENTVSQEATNLHTDLLLLTQTLIQYAEEQPPASYYVDQNIWYRTQLPDLGYVTSPLPDVNVIPGPAQLPDVDFGERLVILDTEASPQVRIALEHLKEQGYVSMEVRFERGDFDARYIELLRP